MDTTNLRWHVRELRLIRLGLRDLAEHGEPAHRHTFSRAQAAITVAIEKIDEALSLIERT